MTRTRKIIAGLIVAVLILLLVAFMSIDAIAASVIRSQGTTILGVKTDVSSVKLGIFSDDTQIRGLKIANPEGFEKPDFVQLTSADIAASIGTMLSDKIEIPTVILQGLTLDLEQIDDRLNANVIVEHVSAATSSETSTEPSERVHLNIGKLEIHDIRLTATGSIVNLAGGKLDAEIPSFTMENVGTKTEEGDITSQVVSLALSILLKHIQDNPVQGLSGAAVGSIATALESVPGLRKIGVGKALLEVNRGLNEGLGKATDEIKNLGDNIGEGLGGLLGGGKGKSPSGESSDEGKKETDKKESGG
ncbi:MAG: AsmA family protein [Phycisphaerales bacterium]|nr:AsmA family protein [Phycisphaerales bacterium]